MSALLSPAGIIITVIIGIALVVANLADVLNPDKPERTLYALIRDARKKGGGSDSGKIL